jgi:hypothetical protein
MQKPNAVRGILDYTLKRKTHMLKSYLEQLVRSECRLFSNEQVLTLYFSFDLFSKS